MKSKWLKITFYLIAVGVLQEIVFRLCFPLPELSNFDRGLYTVLNEEKARGYVRNRTYFWQSTADTPKKYIHSYNGYGFRDSDWNVDKIEGTDRVLFVGDSYVESVMSDTTMTEYFRACSSSGSLEVMNAGMLGTGVSRYLKLLSDMVPIFQPDAVVLVIYANDFENERTDIPTHYKNPEFYNRLIPRIVELYNQWRSGASVPFRWLQVPKPLFPNENDDAFAWKSILNEIPNHADQHLVKAMKAGTFNHYRMNELHREESYLKRKREMLVPMDYLRFYSSKFNFKPIVVYIPSRNQITDNYRSYELALCKSCDSSISLTDSVYNENQRLLGAACKKVGIPFINLSTVMATQERLGNHLYWNYDGHLNEEGTRLVAQTVYAFYQKQAYSVN